LQRLYTGWTIERFVRITVAIGPATTALCSIILDEWPRFRRRPRQSGLLDPMEATGLKLPYLAMACRPSAPS